jgi:hypothetical protein
MDNKIQHTKRKRLQMKIKKLKDTKENDPKWIIEISGALFDRNIKDLSD